MHGLAMLAFLANAAGAEPAASEGETVHYGAPMLVVDAASVGLFAGGVALANLDSDLAYFSVFPVVAAGIGYYYISPSLHLGAGKSWTARGSFVMRVLVPVAGLAVGANATSCSSGGSILQRCTFRGAIGAAAAIVLVSSVDAFALAKTTSPTPYVSPTDGGATAGFFARF